MLRLKDGPAKGTYIVKRAPKYLRAVVNEKGGTDVLDQLTDTPMENERVHIYQRIGEAHSVHVSMANRRHSGFYMSAEYVHIPDVDGETVRDTAEWRAWCAIEGNTRRKPTCIGCGRTEDELHAPDCPHIHGTEARDG